MNSRSAGGRSAACRNLESGRTVALLHLVGLVATLTVGCGERGPVSDTERAAVVAVGQPAATAMAQTLVTHLTQALEEGGPAHAVEFCSGEALSLTAESASAAGPGITLKRVSFRFRNPENAPDDLEAEALSTFEALEAEGRPLPAELVQRVPDGYRYYMPLRVAGFCLQCHGTADQIAPEVRRVLAERYPDDRAVGYSEGDFRGLVRVGVPMNALRTTSTEAGASTEEY